MTKGMSDMHVCMSMSSMHFCMFRRRRSTQHAWRDERAADCLRFASPAEATCRLEGSEAWRLRGLECLMIGGFFVWFLDCFRWKTTNAIISELSQKSLPKSSPGDPQTGPGDSPES